MQVVCKQYTSARRVYLQLSFTWPYVCSQAHDKKCLVPGNKFVQVVETSLPLASRISLWLHTKACTTWLKSLSLKGCTCNPPLLLPSLREDLAHSWCCTVTLCCSIQWALSNSTGNWGLLTQPSLVHVLHCMSTRNYCVYVIHWPSTWIHVHHATGLHWTPAAYSMHTKKKKKGYMTFTTFTNCIVSMVANIKTTR